MASELWSGRVICFLAPEKPWLSEGDGGGCILIPTTGYLSKVQA